jgi:hypothetical protein
MLARIAELDIAEQSEHVLPGDAATNAQHRAAMTAALVADDRIVSQCENEYSPARVACVLGAKSSAAVRDCASK